MSEESPLLLITCSTRGDDSRSTQLAWHFVEQLGVNADLPAFDVDHLDLSKISLPDFDEVAVAAKYAVFAGETLTPEQSRVWQGIEQHIQRFRSAAAIVLAVPVWNFGVPYKLKHYIDVITQPKQCFTWSPAEGYQSLMPEKPAFIFSSSASDYSAGSGNEPDDFCMAYLQRWLTVYMNCAVQSISDAPTVHDEAIVEGARNRALSDIERLAKQVKATTFADPKNG